MFEHAIKIQHRGCMDVDMAKRMNPSIFFFNPPNPGVEAEH